MRVVRYSAAQFHQITCILIGGVNPAVLPSLQKLYSKRFRQRADVRSLDVSLPLEPSPESVWSFDNKMTLADLLIGFFEYYAFKFESVTIFFIANPILLYLK